MKLRMLYIQQLNRLTKPRKTTKGKIKYKAANNKVVSPASLGVYEVKFLSNPRMIKLRLGEADSELNKQINKLRKTAALEDLNIFYKMIILVTYNFKGRINRGILLIKIQEI